MSAPIQTCWRAAASTTPTGIAGGPARWYGRVRRYGNMGEQVIGLDVALPDGSVVHRRSRVRMDNTGYDLTSLFIGAAGTLGVITGLDLRLHPMSTHRVTAICGFANLDALVEAGRMFRDVDGIAALELIDARASELTAEHVGVAAPVGGCLAAAHRAGRRHRPNRATRRRARRCAAVRRARGGRRRQRAAAAVAGP
jgi:FAD/FMN-containing dehydrogenase